MLEHLIDFVECCHYDYYMVCLRMESLPNLRSNRSRNASKPTLPHSVVRAILPWRRPAKNRTAPRPIKNNNSKWSALLVIVFALRSVVFSTFLLCWRTVWAAAGTCFTFVTRIPAMTYQFHEPCSKNRIWVLSCVRSVNCTENFVDQDELANENCYKTVEISCILKFVFESSLFTTWKLVRSTR